MSVDEVHGEDEDPGHEQQQYDEISNVVVGFPLELLRVVHTFSTSMGRGQDNSGIKLGCVDAGHRDSEC